MLKKLVLEIARSVERGLCPFGASPAVSCGDQARLRLMRRNTRLGVLTPSARLNGVLSSQFAAVAAFAPIHSRFEEAHHRMETQQNWRDWDTSHQRVAALGLTLLREAGVRMELNALRIHEHVLRCASVGRRVWPRVLVSSAFPPSLSCGRISLEYASERRETV